MISDEYQIITVNDCKIIVPNITLHEQINSFIKMSGGSDKLMYDIVINEAPDWFDYDIMLYLLRLKKIPSNYQKQWSEEDKEYLKTNADTLTDQEIAINLNRTVMSVQQQKHRLSKA